MQLQKSTLALSGLAIALLLGVVVYETAISDGPRSEEAEAADPLFSFAETDVQQLEIERDDATLAFERTADGWQMTAPQDAAAEPAAIAYLLNILTADPTLQALTAPADALQQYGLDAPKATLTLTLATGSVHTLQVGGTDFTADNRYVLVDSPADLEEVTVRVVSGGLTNAVERPVAGWLVGADAETSAEDSAAGEE